MDFQTISRATMLHIFKLKWFIYVCMCFCMHTPIVYIRLQDILLCFYFFRTISQKVREGITTQNQFFLLQKISVWDSVKCSLWQTHHPSGLYSHNITFFFFSSSLVFYSPAQNESQSIISLISCVIGATVPWAFLTVLEIVSALRLLYLLWRLVTFYFNYLILVILSFMKTFHCNNQIGGRRVKTPGFFSDTFFLKCLCSTLHIIYSSVRYSKKIYLKRTGWGIKNSSFISSHFSNCKNWHIWSDDGGK